METLSLKHTGLVLISGLPTARQRLLPGAEILGVQAGEPPTTWTWVSGWLAGGHGAGRRGVCSVSALTVVLAPSKCGHVIYYLLAFFPLLGRLCIKQKEFPPLPQFCFLFPFDVLPSTSQHTIPKIGVWSQH